MSLVINAIKPILQILTIVRVALGYFSWKES